MIKNGKKASEFVINWYKQLITADTYILETYNILVILRDVYGWDINPLNRYSVIWKIVNAVVKILSGPREQQTATNLALSESYANNTNRSELDTTFRGISEKLNDIMFVDFSNVEYNTSLIPDTLYYRINYLKFYIWTNSNYTDSIAQRQLVWDTIGNNENVGYLANGSILGYYVNSEGQSIPTAYTIGTTTSITITINYRLDPQEPLDFDADNKLKAECQAIVDNMFSEAGTDIFYTRFLGSTNNISGILAHQIIISDTPNTTTLTNQDWITPTGTKNIITIQTARVDL